MKSTFTALFRVRDKPQDSISIAPSFFVGTDCWGKSVNLQSSIYDVRDLLTLDW